MNRKASIILTCLTLAIIGCVHTSPQKVAVNALFTVGLSVNNSYSAYLDGVLQGHIKTNSFPKVSRDYQTFQQLFGLAVNELPGTNGIAAALSNGAQVLADISLAKKGIP